MCDVVTRIVTALTPELVCNTEPAALMHVTSQQQRSSLAAAMCYLHGPNQLLWLAHFCGLYCDTSWGTAQYAGQQLHPWITYS